MKPVISIITPSYNQAQYIEQTIDSVLSQRYENLQYIVIDGGSKDGSVEIIKKYEKHLSYWVSEPDHGQSHAINKGILKSNGDVLNWLNSDDYLEPGSLQIISEQFGDPTLEVLIGRSNIILNGQITRSTNGTDIYNNNLAKTLGWARIDQPETYFRKTVFDKLYPVDEMLHFSMDKEFWMRYLIEFGLSGVRKISDILVNFRLHQDSKTTNHKNDFERESNGLMFQMASTNELSSYSEAIEKLSPIDKQKFIIVRPGFRATPTLALDALNYFFLYKADEFYYNERYKECLSFLSLVKPQLLAEYDRALYSNLKFKSRYIPKRLIKMYRSWM